MNWDSYSDCYNNDWLFMPQTSFVNSAEWLLSPYSSNSFNSAFVYASGFIGFLNESYRVKFLFAVRPSFYLDSTALKIVGGIGTSARPYHIG